MTSKSNGPAPEPGSRRTIVLAAAIGAIAAMAGFGAVYVMARTPDNGRAPDKATVRLAQAPSAPSASTAPAALPSGPGSNALSTGQMAAFVFKKVPEALPDTANFIDAAGKERTFKDWRGKVVLLNLWATWCIPCRKEMPGIERLQTALGSDKFEVVAVSIDRTGIEGAKKFLDGIKVSKLGVYADPSVRMTAALKAIGLPATLLIDREGREVGRLTGPAEWDSPEAKALIRAVIGK